MSELTPRREIETLSLQHGQLKQALWNIERLLSTDHPLTCHAMLIDTKTGEIFNLVGAGNVPVFVAGVAKDQLLKQIAAVEARLDALFPGSHVYRDPEDVDK